ncbi:MAG TPA: RIO1 family regulatory kinase/ATPase, partial [Methanolinea sp.]|nr:RIO1 family regulatory kinase/ATPase [Methanolinea sp.]
DPAGVMDSILAAVGEAYRLGVIHADLSEFNVMIDGNEVVLIDWPQWISPDHPNAGEILARDVGNLVRYFSRKYRISTDLETAIERVTG